MEERRVERRLAAVLAADVAGYSRLMGCDEEGTLGQLKMFRKILVDPKIATHRGRIVKTTGDGMLVEFASAVDAARCAVDVQKSMAEQNIEVPKDKRIEFRIGIHVGDIIIDDNDIFGDGVNIAARLEGIAEPGGICISDDAHRQIRSKLNVSYDDLGPRALKNIAEPMRTWRLRLGGEAALIIPPGPTSQPLLALPNKPSIAVLPFQNMSGDPEQEYFADGIVEDIITALSQFKSLFVIARNSSFTYKGRAVDIKQVGRELGVRYVLEGSVRKSGRRLRITAQLIDAATGAHLWADRFEGALDDVFDLQDQLTSSVVSAIGPRVERAEIERAKHKPTESLDAYDNFLRGMANLYQLNREAYAEALRLFYKSIELDPEFAHAYAMAAWCYALRRLQGWTTDRPRENAEAERLARRAVDLRKDDASVLGWAGYSLAIVVGALADASAFIGQALELNPNLALVWGASGWMKVRIGEQDLAIEHFTRAIRLNPLDPGMVIVQSGTANAHFCAGRYDEAASWAAKALRTNPNALSAVRVAAAANALIGRPEDARKAMNHLLQLDPTRRISNLREATGPHQPEDFARFVDGLRKAGLPE